MRHNAYAAYVNNEILTAEPLELVIMLYRGALESIGRARACVRSRDIAGRAAAINKTLAIVGELSSALDHQRGGEISRNLAGIYNYVQRKLIDANVQQSEAPLAECEQLLSTMLDAWQGCCEHVRKETAALTSAPVYAEAERVALAY
jgi:flagellar protein FliS